MDRVVVAMSGGVDSSVAAALLLKEGYEVVGMTMRIGEFEGSCCSLDSVADARRVAQKLGIKHYVINLADEFSRTVIENFCEEYRRGRTPNPCVICNSVVKWGFLLRRALEIDARHIATGHYARVIEEGGRFALLKGRDEAKDQSYFLYGLTQEQLSRTLFPLGDYTKAEVRQMASELGLPVAKKRDSQEICFAPGGDYTEFLRSRGISFPEGDILDTSGRVVGRHRGIGHYTIGQRRGIGAHNKPMYVVDIDPAGNTVTIGESCYGRELEADNLNFIVEEEEVYRSGKVSAKVRYKQDPDPATVRNVGEGRIHVVFRRPRWGITPGQSVVLYEGDRVLGGGIIRGRHQNQFPDLSSVERDGESTGMDSMP
ncbi:MAG: tRNA 2-thiouridine(34) synthase MnmA [bacterium]